jgi:D-methionine transport system permease protein
MSLAVINDLMTNVDWGDITQATSDTLFMLGFAVLFSTIIGIPVGILLFLTSKGRLLQNKPLYSVLSFVVNVLRSIPFIILLIVMIPATTFLVGTSLGAKGTIPPLVVGAFPFFARLVENALKEIDDGIFHMAESWQIIWHILLPEIMPSLIASVTVTAIALVSYTAMAGAVGGGGLGDLAIRYGYQRFETDVMVITVVLMVIMVQLIQFLGDFLVKVMRKK